MLFLFLLGTTGRAFSQMTKFKALFLYNFTQNVEWPSTISSDEFIIAVIGDKEMASELEELARVKKVGSKTMVVRYVQSVKELGDAHLVYLSSNKSNLMPVLSANQQGRTVLLVSSNEGLCAKGAAISFVIVDGKLRYEICEANFEKHGLKVNKKLISLGMQAN